MGSIVQDKSVKAPSVTSLYACNRHPELKRCIAHANESYAKHLEPVTAKERCTPNSKYAKLGAGTAFLYPNGDWDRLPVTIDGYMAFLFLDDLIDDSTDIDYVKDIARRLLSAANREPTEDKRFSLFSNFFRDPRWDERVLKMVQDDAQRVMDGAMALREIEAKECIVTLEEYLNIRIPNTAMGFMFRAIGFAQPDVAEDLFCLIANEPSLWDRIEQASGKCIGIALDLYKLNGKHSEVCDYTNAVRITQREQNIPQSEAIERMVAMFYQYEKEMGRAVQELASRSPRLAQAIADVQGGTLAWMTGERGSRYS